MQPDFKKIHSFENNLINKRSLKDLMYQAFLNYGIVKSSIIADRVKNLTFHFATQSGVSLSVEDLRVPAKKRELIGLTRNEVETTQKRYEIGSITSVEKFQKTIDIWNNANNFLKDDVLTYFRESDPLNPLYIMAFSGARGNISQVRQLVGMRGLMSNPQGQIIDLPIKSNFREGLTVTEYIISSYGARKGLVDTALRTADSGYLTRRLVDVAQDIIVRESDCGTTEGLWATELASNNFLNLRGRLLAEPIFTQEGNLFAPANTEITETFLQTLKTLKDHSPIKVRSSLTCTSTRSVCQNCYGWHLSHSKLVDLGEAVGIVAAQSIGEPGTQLTMRTFHTGGVFSGDLTRQVRSPMEGKIEYWEGHKASLFRTMHGKMGFRLKEEVNLIIKNSFGTTISFEIPTESLLLVNTDQYVYENEIIAEIQKDTNLILEEEQKEIYSETSGEVFFNALDVKVQADKQGNTYKTNNKAGLIWILQGSFYELPAFSETLLKPGLNLSKNTLLSRTPLYNKYPGWVQIDKSDNGTGICVQNFSVTLTNAFINEKVENSSRLQIKTDNQDFQFQLTTEPNSVLKQGDTIAVLDDNTYRTTTGGIVTYSLENPQASKKRKSVKNLFKGYFYWIPEETFKFSTLDEVRLSFSKNESIVGVGEEIMPNTFSKVGGFFQIKEAEQEVTIKPGELFELTSAESQIFDKSDRFVKPGNFIVPGKIITQQLVYLEFFELNEKQYILARPVQVFEVPKEEDLSLSQSFFPYNSHEHIKLKVIKRVFYKNWEKIISNNGINLLQTFIVFDFKQEQQGLEPRLEFTPSKVPGKSFLKIALYEVIKTFENNRKSSHSSLPTTTRNFVSNKQYVASNTLIGQIETTAGLVNKLAAINPHLNSGNMKEVLILNPSDLKKVFCPNVELLKKVSVGDLVRIGTLLNDNVKSPYSGQILEIFEDHILIRLSQPYLISAGTILHATSNNLVKAGDILATLVYETIKTTDIVQGLPKVEELLEARKVLHNALLAPCPGYAYVRFNKHGESTVQLIGLDNEVQILALKPGIKTKFNSGDFVEVSSALTDGLISPHTKLETLFSYFKNRYTSFEACKLSFKLLQLFLIGEIQRTYRSQGVDIADKHVELIVKQMTSKVCIEDSGTTTFLPGEVLNFQKMADIALVAENKGEIPPSYVPLLLGITKASLNSDSFISAASFQETTRVLTEAAIEGRKDWLTGLKENVIIGRLIPAGTGFNYLENQERLAREKGEIDATFHREAKPLSENILDLRLVKKE